MVPSTWASSIIHGTAWLSAMLWKHVRLKNLVILFDNKGSDFRMFAKTKGEIVDNGLLHTEKILADRKTFYIDLKENARGRVVKITEDVGGNRDTIMVPIDILDDFIQALQDIKATSDSI
jgi:alkyl hydroperoxide reductase subunit AhpC